MCHLKMRMKKNKCRMVINMKRIVFMGTPEISSIILERLIDDGFDIAAVVTQPDKPKGRGNVLSCSPVKELALKKSITVLQPEKLKDEEFQKTIKTIDPEIIIVAAFGQKVPVSILELPKYGCINVHASLLPKYRGASPIQWVILNGESETGVTIMYMAEGIDTGDMIYKVKVPIAEDETGGSLHDKLAAVGAQALITALGQIENNTAKRIKQNDEESTYVKIIDKSLGLMDFTKPAAELERYIRGLNPWPGAFTSIDGKMLKFWKGSVENTDSVLACGCIEKITRDMICISTGKGLLCISELQLEGKKRMSTEEFLRGYKVAVGMLLG